MYLSLLAKNKVKIIIAALTATSVVLFCVVIWQAVFDAPDEEVAMSDSGLDKAINNIKTNPSIASSVAKTDTDEGKSVTENAVYPEELRIPAIDLKAKVVEVGITKKGNMAAPRSFSDVGWYKYGTLPGSLGSAVIAGHVDNGLALPGVFKNLDELKKGDDVYVVTGEGEEIHFRVTESKVYAYDASTEKIFNQKDGTYLRLITCTGGWLPQYRTHDQRIVVSAIKV